MILPTKDLFHSLASVDENMHVLYAFHHEESPVQQLIKWVPTHWKAKRGGPTTKYINTLLRDVGLENVTDQESCMRD